MQMLSRFAMFIGLATAAGCAGGMPKPQPALVARFDQKGVSPRERAVESGTLIQFVNEDVRPHEIYSNDCRELGSTTLVPGQAFVVRVDGPKVCHFQDLLSPAAPEYWGTVRVAEPPTPSVNVQNG
jgi:plastocyanin